MVSRLWLATSATLLLIGGSLTAQEASDPRIAELIKQLDADKADQREAATAELRKIGAPVLPTLEKILAEPPSIEAKFRIQAAIDGIKLDLARQQAPSIDDILAQAKAAQKEGWDKQTLEKQLDALVRVLAAETGSKDLKLPVTFGGLQPPPGGAIGISQGMLIKEKRVRFPNVEKSIVLSGSIADVSFARNSIIIAPVAVCMSHCENCLVITGRLAVTSNATNSVVLCNSRVEASFARGSILAGPEAVTVSSAEQTVFVNSQAPPPRFAGDPRGANKSVQAQGIKFGEKGSKDPLDGKLTLTLATQQDQALALFKLPDGTGEYVARYEQEIKTPQGQPIESLKGWKLIYAGNRLAVFANGEEIGCVRQGM